MIGLLTMLFSTLGATGMASGLKMLGGLIDRIGQASETRAKAELLREIERSKLDVTWQQTVFGGGEDGKFARSTRRTLAIMGMCVFGAIGILGMLFPDVPLVTFLPPEQSRDFALLWGLVRFPLDKGTTVEITTGHMALLAMVNCGTIFGFYFTPGGRK